MRALGDLVAREPSPRAELEIVYGSWDPLGARLLDVVSVMDRLRSPGGCPWDAEQTHVSLAPYLIEESYEAVDAIESRDLDLLREELGDVLLQVAFHARVAEELPDDQRWSIDDVAGELVTKLVRRHPHVFADRSVSGAAEVAANWEVIKAAEKERSSAIDGIPFGQPALSLAAALLRREPVLINPPAAPYHNRRRSTRTNTTNLAASPNSRLAHRAGRPRLGQYQPPEECKTTLFASAPPSRSTTRFVAETVAPTTPTATNPDFGRPGRRVGGWLAAVAVVPVTLAATDPGAGR